MYANHLIKPSLQLRIGQQLTMTPQLQQAIRLLQLSSLELQQEVQTALESNIMLEAEEEEPEEVFDGLHWQMSSAGAEIKDDYLQQLSQEQSLRDYLHWQKNLSFKHDQDLAIATAIIDNLDEDGYLRISLDDIQLSLKSDYPDISSEDMEAVLQRIQSFDPPGIAARSIAESLSLQLKALPEEQAYRQEALELVDHHFNLLQQNQLIKIQRSLHWDENKTQAVLSLIHSLDPHPGYQIATPPTDYIIPDVIVYKKKERWQVRLNPELIPKLRINPYYAQLARSENSDLLKEHLQEARWLIKSLQGRNETLLKVAQQIVKVQQDFFERGEEAMKPLILKDIADAIDMHESTVSRITNGKYMLTPRGVFEFKYFFSSHISTQDGDASATAIRARIRKLILSENPKKPLSDNKISQLLAAEGIKVARRTVAKYREAMAIPPSNERKRLV